MERMADRIVLVWNEPESNGEQVSGFGFALLQSLDFPHTLCQRNGLARCSRRFL
jgi:hypothetical protein